MLFVEAVANYMIFFLYQGSYSELSDYNKKTFGFGAAAVLHLTQRIQRMIDSLKNYQVQKMEPAIDNPFS